MADDAGGKAKPYRTVRGNPGIYAYNLKNGQLRYAAVATFKGRQSWSSGHRKVDDAKAAKEKALRKLGGASNGQTLADYLDIDWIESVEVSAGSLRTYKVAVANIIAWLKSAHLEALKLEQVEERHIQQFKTWMRRRGLADNTANRTYAKLAQALQHAWRLRLIPENPCARLKAPPKGKYRPPQMGVAELKALLESAYRSPYGLMVYFAVVSGLREEKEIFAARWADLDMTTGTLNTLGKGDKLRYVVLDPDTLELMRVHRLEQMKRLNELGADTPQLIFVNHDGNAWTQSNFFEHWDRIRRAAALPTLHFHDLRHLHTTLGARAGVTAAVMQARLGHADASMTLNVYTHTDVEDQRPAAAAISAYVRDVFDPSDADVAHKHDRLENT